jgi:hypothetical protein
LVLGRGKGEKRVDSGELADCYRAVMARQRLQIQASELVVCALMAMAVTASVILPGVARATPVKVDMRETLSSPEISSCTNTNNKPSE